LSHDWQRGVAAFDDANLVSCAGLVPVMELAEQTGLSRLLDEHVWFTSERVRSGAANPTPKLTSIIAGLAAGADSIDDLDVIRAGGTKRLFTSVYAPTTLGTLLREFTGGHVGQLQAVHRRHLLALADRTGVLAGIAERAFVDIDSLLRPVYGHGKQGASFGHTKIAGKLVNVPARFVRPQGRPTLRLPAHWPHAKSWTSCGTTSSAERPPSKSRPNTAAGSPDGYIDPDQAIWFGGWGGAFIRAPCTWTVGVRGPASCIRSMARLARAPSPPT